MSEFSDPQINFRVRPMALPDVDRVAAIEKLCFSNPWPPDTYRRDLRYHGASHYLVLEELSAEPTIVGFAGYWLIQGEIHISTIGVHPDYRGRGLGELLFATMLREAQRHGCRLATLEVRVSNHVAQALYFKYGFRVVGRRRQYYRDNNEDAFVMELSGLQTEQYRQALAERWERLLQRLRSEARLSHAGNAHRGEKR